MEKISNEQALSFIDSFLTEVKEEKTAEESPITVNTSDTGGEAAGTVPASVEGSQDNSPEKTKEEEGKPAQGEFGKEKSQDVEDATDGTGVEDAGADNTEKVDDERAAGDFGQEAIESEVIDTPSYIEAEKMKVAEEINMKNELERAHNLSNAIVEKIATQVELEKEAGIGGALKATGKVVGKAGKAVGKAGATAGKAVGKAGKAVGTAGKETGKAAVKAGKSKSGQIAAAGVGGAGAGAAAGYAAGKKKKEEKKAAELDLFMKEAADEAYHDFVTSYQLGLIKRAQDEVAMQEALGMAPEEASGILDEVATEDPEAVMPPGEEVPAEVTEEVPAEATEEIPAEVTEEVPAEMGGEEVGEEGIDEEALLEALVEAGVTPEELEAAMGSVDEEDQALEVQAADEERFEGIKNIVRAARS